MKTSSIITSLLYLTTFTSALPPQRDTETRDIISIPDASSFDPALSHQLEKRRGGGGGRGGGSSSGGRSGGSSSSGGRATSANSFSPSSNLGGRTRDGSGSPPSYGGRYTGGAAVPYTAGARRGGITPFLLPIGALAVFPALWLFPIYAYPYGGYGYHWLDNDGRNRTANVTCLCQEYSVCGCEDPNDQDSNKTALADQLTNGTGTGAPVNTTMVKLVDYGNGNTTAYINGTLDNGTTAPGGTDPSNEDQLNGAARLMQNYGGYWLMIAIVGLLVNVA